MTCNAASLLGGVTPIIPMILAGTIDPRDCCKPSVRPEMPESSNAPVTARKASLLLDAGAPDHFAEARGLRGDEIAERLRRAERHHGALRDKAVAGIGRGQRRGGLAVEPADDRRRRAGRRQQSEPGADFERI